MCEFKTVLVKENIFAKKWNVLANLGKFKLGIQNVMASIFIILNPECNGLDFYYSFKFRKIQIEINPKIIENTLFNFPSIKSEIQDNSQ